MFTCHIIEYRAFHFQKQPNISTSRRQVLPDIDLQQMMLRMDRERIAKTTYCKSYLKHSEDLTIPTHKIIIRTDIILQIKITVGRTSS